MVGNCKRYVGHGRELHDIVHTLPMSIRTCVICSSAVVTYKYM